MATLAGLVAALGGGAASAARTSDPPTPALRVGVSVADARVVLYGDSLASEAEPYFVAALHGLGVRQVVTHTYGGTAICDWLDQMRTDAAELAPTTVVVEFSGNALTPCMTGPDGSSLVGTPELYHRRYREDVAEVMQIFSGSGTRIYLVGAPISRWAEEHPTVDGQWHNALYSAFARFSPGVEYIDAGAAVLRDGRWTETLPCLPTEPCTGGVDDSGTAVNVVRAPDGGHFCPGAADAVRGVTIGCAVWSSGAYRYGTAMASGLADGLLPV